MCTKLPNSVSRELNNFTMTIKGVFYKTFLLLDISPECECFYEGAGLTGFSPSDCWQFSPQAWSQLILPPGCLPTRLG